MDWQSDHHRADHFRDHGAEVGARSVEEYNASAHAVIENDDADTFLYRGIDTDLDRIGLYDPLTGLFTALTEEQEWIVTHYRTDPEYIRGLKAR